MENINLVDLTLLQVAILLIVLAAVDTAGSIAIALAAGNFVASYAKGFILSHVARIWTPIFGVAVIGHGIPVAGIPPLPPVSAFASVMLLAYLVDTVTSLRGSFADRSAVPTG